jgi:hypothetical protein
MARRIILPVRKGDSRRKKDSAMPIALRYITTQPNKTVTFDFGSAASVLSFTVGIAYWSFTFGEDDHHVETLSLGIATNKISPSQIATKVSGTLSDQSGNNIDNADSSVVVCCVAVVTSADGDLTLASANGIPNNGNSPSFALPSANLSIAASFLSGFDLSYGSVDHHVQQVHTTAGFGANGTLGWITALVGMSDSSGNPASTATIGGGLAAADTSEHGLYSRGQTDLQTTDQVAVEFGTNISDAVVLLQDLDVRFDDEDHHIKTIGGGVASWTLHATSVTLNGARAFMDDDSGHNQSGSGSWVSVVVLALPA